MDMTPNVVHAIVRRAVRLPSGKTGRLTYMPDPKLAPRGDRRRWSATVRLASGAHVSVRPDELRLLDPPALNPFERTRVLTVLGHCP
jgi:hypothetical protein